MSKLATWQQLTNVQRSAFFTVLAGTATLLGVDKEDYRHRIMKEEVGVDHLSEVTRTDGYDKLMCRIYQDRGDYDRASEYLTGSLTRWRHLIVSAAGRIVRLSGYKGSGYDYLRGVMVKSGMMPDGSRLDCERLMSERAWLDFTNDDLRNLLSILNSRLRSLNA